jgi:hypothetical protein
MVLMEYSKNSVTSFELPFRDNLCVFASSGALDEEDFLVDGCRGVAVGIVATILFAKSLGSIRSGG